ncbi:MAG: DsbA family protein [Holophagae bacterium]
MRLCRMTFAAGLVLATASMVMAQTEEAPAADDVTFNWMKRAIAYYPDSTFKLLENSSYETPNGTYRIVRIERKCDSRLLSGEPSALVDEVTNSIWMGSIGELPFTGTGASVDAIKNFVQDFLPEALQANMNMRARVEWDISPRKPGALIPMSLMVRTGYGEYRRPAAVTADGRFLVMAAEASRDEDPVTARRRQLAASDVVIWDSEHNGDASVEIVEFSDFECPACRGKWPLIKDVVETNGNKARHGMVSFPLTMIHPWAFRSASATWCVGEQNPKSVIPLKELFYGLQREMEVSLVKPTAEDFVAGHGLDDAAFAACYLKEPSIEAVHRQIGLGQVMGVRATPTYYVNGWLVQVPNQEWFPQLVADLAAGKEPM